MSLGHFCPTPTPGAQKKKKNDRKLWLGDSEDRRGLDSLLFLSRRFYGQPLLSRMGGVSTFDFRILAHPGHLGLLLPDDSETCLVATQQFLYYEKRRKGSTFINRQKCRVVPDDLRWRRLGACSPSLPCFRNCVQVQSTMASNPPALVKLRPFSVSTIASHGIIWNPSES